MNERQIEIMIEAIEDYIQIHGEEGEYFCKQDYFSGEFIRSYLENLGADALENAGESRDFEYTEEEVQRINGIVNRDRYESSNYAASRDSLLAAIHKMVEEADNRDRPYSITEGFNNWSWDNLKDHICEKYYNEWKYDDSANDLDEAEEYDIYDGHVVKCRNGYILDDEPVYWIE